MVEPEELKVSAFAKISEERSELEALRTGYAHLKAQVAVLLQNSKSGVNIVLYAAVERTKRDVVPKDQDSKMFHVHLKRTLRLVLVTTVCKTSSKCVSGSIVLRSGSFCRTSSNARVSPAVGQNAVIKNPNNKEQYVINNKSVCELVKFFTFTFWRIGADQVPVCIK